MRFKQSWQGLLNSIEQSSTSHCDSNIHKRRTSTQLESPLVYSIIIWGISKYLASIEMRSISKQQFIEIKNITIFSIWCHYYTTSYLTVYFELIFFLSDFSFVSIMALTSGIDPSSSKTLRKVSTKKASLWRLQHAMLLFQLLMQKLMQQTPEQKQNSRAFRKRVRAMGGIQKVFTFMLYGYG